MKISIAVFIVCFLLSPTAYAEIDPHTIVFVTNQYRAAHNMQPLQENPQLNAAAQNKAKELASGASFSHTGIDGTFSITQIKKAGYPAYLWGENLARLYQADATDTVVAWENSPEHNKNLLSIYYLDIGIGVQKGYYKGYLVDYIVQEFGYPSYN